MIRNPNARAKIARAMLVALVPFTLCVQVALAHASPIVQTFRNNVTLTAFSGTFEVIWPLQVTSLNAVIELRDLVLADPVAAPLLRATGGDAVESPSTCPTVGATSTCSRIHLSGIPELAPGRYAMYWSVTHLDGFVEQRSVRFTIDPAWVSPSPLGPSPTPTVTPTPSTTATPTTKPSANPSVAPTPSATPVASPRSSPTDLNPTVVPTPIPLDRDTVGTDVGGTDGVVFGVLVAVGLAVLLLRAGRSARSPSDAPRRSQGER